MFREYVDFEIEFHAPAAGTYPFSVQGPGGEDRGALVYPQDDEFRALLEGLAVLYTDEGALQRLGLRLFELLFAGPARDVLARSQGSLGAGQGLRFKLNIGPTEQQVGALPWEFMYDPNQGHIALLDTSIVRYLPLAARVTPLQATLPLKVLITAAQTDPKPEVGPELDEVKAALADLGDQVQIAVEEHLTPTRLQRRLREGFHVWHFIGHGTFKNDGSAGRIHFENDSGGTRPASAAELTVMLRGSGVRLVVLDACQGGRLATDPFRSLAPALVRAQIPAVVAMQFTVPQTTTRAFATEFYRAIAGGFPIDACVTEGRRAVMNASGLDRPDWGIPVVYTRAPDGQLFDLSSAAEARPAADRPAPAGVNITISGSTVSDSPISVGGGGVAKDELRAKQSALRALEVQRDQYGLSPPVHILNDIQALEQEIEELKRRQK